MECLVGHTPAGLAEGDVDATDADRLRIGQRSIEDQRGIHDQRARTVVAVTGARGELPLLARVD